MYYASEKVLSSILSATKFLLIIVSVVLDVIMYVCCVKGPILGSRDLEGRLCALRL